MWIKINLFFSQKKEAFIWQADLSWRRWLVFIFLVLFIFLISVFRLPNTGFVFRIPFSVVIRCPKCGNAVFFATYLKCKKLCLFTDFYLNSGLNYLTSAKWFITALSADWGSICINIFSNPTLELSWTITQKVIFLLILADVVFFAAHTDLSVVIPSFSYFKHARILKNNLKIYF